MLKPRSPQASFYGSYLYDKIVPQDHLLRKINQVVDFSFVHELVADRYTADRGRPAGDPSPNIQHILTPYINLTAGFYFDKLCHPIGLLYEKDSF